jgi:hypothetical protein
MDPFSYLSVLISIILALGMTRVLAGVGEMLQGALASPHLLGARRLDRQSVSVFGGGVVDLLSLAQPNSRGPFFFLSSS